MTPRPKRITLAQFKSIIEEYHELLPNWRMIHKDTLVREQGPVAQGITFERLSYGAYRPIGYIRVLVAPEDFWGFELPQNLSNRLRSVDLRAHDRMRDQVAEAICREFVPNVQRPLVPEEVLHFYEREAIPSSPETYSLAALNAYLGHDERALYWCSRFDELVNELSLGWQDFDYKRRSFLDKLEGWIKAGVPRLRLEEVLEEERRKWELAS